MTPLVLLGAISPLKGGAKLLTHPFKDTTKLAKARYLIERILSPLFEKQFIGLLKERSPLLSRKALQMGSYLLTDKRFVVSRN
jgi:hypothetical protein